VNRPALVVGAVVFGALAAPLVAVPPVDSTPAPARPAPVLLTYPPTTPRLVIPPPATSLRLETFTWKLPPLQTRRTARPAVPGSRSPMRVVATSAAPVRTRPALRPVPAAPSVAAPAPAASAPSAVPSTAPAPAPAEPVEAAPLTPSPTTVAATPEPTPTSTPCTRGRSGKPCHKGAAP
jgi:hypothetical protein